jgi:hypothetical protein
MYWLFLLPFIALLYPFYLHDEPRLAGCPCFYWYQFAVLIGTAVLTYAIYLTRGAAKR